MEIGKWRLENGILNLENGKWKLENRKWNQENGNRKMEIGQQKYTNVIRMESAKTHLNYPKLYKA